MSGRLIITGLCQTVSALAFRSPPYFCDDPIQGHRYPQYEDDFHRVPFMSKHTICDFDNLIDRFLEHVDSDGFGPDKQKLQRCTFDDLQIPVDAIYLQIARWSSCVDPMGTLYALILESTDQPSCYRRIGRAEIPTCNQIATIGWKLETFMII